MMVFPEQARQGQKEKASYGVQLSLMRQTLAECCQSIRMMRQRWQHNKNHSQPICDGG